MTLQEINGFSVGSHRTNRYNSLSPQHLAFQLSGCTWVSITARCLPRLQFLYSCKPQSRSSHLLLLGTHLPVTSAIQV